MIDAYIDDGDHVLLERTDAVPTRARWSSPSSMTAR